MPIIRNPFIINGYISPAYFCDRKAESEILIRQMTNGNNIALISTRRMGKTGLIRHCFQSKESDTDFLGNDEVAASQSDIRL